MRLIKLTANQPGFKSILFNEKGLSIIVGRRHNNDHTQDKKQTYNSVGKSLSIALVHFCLGSQRNPEFEAKLNDWEFTLDFEIEGERYTVTRKCASQSVVLLNGIETPLKAYTQLLAAKIFDIPEEAKYLTFRSLLPRFIRPQKMSYTSYDTFIEGEQSVNTLVNNSFLLGLDVMLIIKKQELKDDLDKVDDMKKAFENDTIIKSFFENNDDDDFEIDVVDLKQRIQKLGKDLSEFRVAEDYYQVVQEADQVKVELKSYENRAATFKSAISNIEKSLDITPDIPKKKIEQLYQEANVNLPESVVRKLEEVEAFNKKILDNRSARLLKEKNDFEKKLFELEAIIKKLGKKKDEKLEYLSTRGALDEFTKMNEQLRDFKIRLDSIEKYRRLKQEYKNKTEELKRDFSLQNTATLEYLEKSRGLIEDNILLFKNLAAEFYENKRAGIEIKINEGLNKVRFEIKAKIDDDKGDGVNDVKIFCFDWTILLGKHNHRVKFIFHDSRLLSEIDSRQQSTLLKVALDNCIANNLQYIISINQNTLDSLKQEMDEDVFEEVVKNNIILELTDESNESKLLGFQVDLDYDKE